MMATERDLYIAILTGYMAGYEKGHYDTVVYSCHDVPQSSGEEWIKDAIMDGSLYDIMADLYKTVE